jgi:hypothetical protein
MRCVVIDTHSGRRPASWRGAVIVAEDEDAPALAAMLTGLHPQITEAPPETDGDSLTFAAWLCLTHEDPEMELP